MNTNTANIFAYAVQPGDVLANTTLPVVAVTESVVDGVAVAVFHYNHGLPKIIRPLYEKVSVRPGTL